MNYYFCADYPAVVKFNGSYQGVFDEQLKSIEYTQTSPLFVEVCPLSQIQPPSNLLITKDFLENPPEGVLVTDLKGGYLIRLCKTNNYFGLKVLCQQKTHEFVATVFYDNGMHFSFETSQGFYSDKLTPYSDNVEIKTVQLQGQPIIALHFHKDKDYLVLYEVGSNFEKLYEFECSKVEFTSSTNSTIYDNVDIQDNFPDIAKHGLNFRLKYENGEIRGENITVHHSEHFAIDKLTEKIIPYAFLEEIFIGGNIEEYLSENLRPNADRIADFLGEFIGIMPPPPFREISQVGVIRKQTERTYRVDYYLFEIKDKKICNLSEVAEK